MRYSNISPISQYAPNKAIAFNFVMWGDIADLMRPMPNSLTLLVQGFRSSDTPDFAILHKNSWSPLQQCKHYRATL